MEKIFNVEYYAGIKTLFKMIVTNVLGSHCILNPFTDT